MPNNRFNPSDSRGFAMVMTLLAMVVLSLAAAAFMLTMHAETNVAGHNLRGSQALNIAEAGVAEAMARLRTGDIPDNGNPRMVAQVFLANAGQVPVLGADSIALGTAQPTGKWLSYSTTGPSDQVLTVHYKTNTARTLIYRYDANQHPPVQTTSGTPIFVLESTGRKGKDQRRVVTEVVPRPFAVSTRAALAADVDVKFVGNAVVCGYNHSEDTPANTGDNGRSGAGGCNEDPSQDHWEIATGDKTGIWTTGSIQGGGGSQSDGVPAEQEGQTNFYAGPWEALTMSQAEFFNWVGPAKTAEPASMNGIIHLDNNGIGQDQSGSFAFHGGTGEGLLYVDGDLTLNSTVTYRGLIYVEGDLKLNGSAWILGGVIVRGKTQVKNNGGATLLYSRDAIEAALFRYGGQFATLSWLEP